MVLLVGFFGTSGLRGYARLFRIDNPAPADAIVLLLGGSPQRPERAAELYKQGYAQRILMGDSGFVGRSTLNESQNCRSILIQEGVPADAIVTLPPPVVTSTFMEAQAVRRYVEKHPMRRIILVTTSFHTRRGRWVFRKELAGNGVDIRAAAAPDPNFDESNWYRKDEGLVEYLSETIKTVYYWVVY